MSIPNQLTLSKMKVIPIQSRYVNAFFFFFVDIPVAWAIHRGLLALQGYYYYKLAYSGHRVPIARSRVPLVSGELLRGLTRFPSIFVLGNVAVLVLILFATLGVNGETRDLWIPNAFTNITSLSSIVHKTPSGHKKYTISCSEESDTDVKYWPVAFNQSESRNHNWTCQQGAPEVEPMLTVRCVPHNGEPCLLKDDSLTIHLTTKIAPQLNITWKTRNAANVDLKEYSVINTTANIAQGSEVNSIFEELNGHKGYAFLIHILKKQPTYFGRQHSPIQRPPERPNEYLQNGSAVILLHDTINNQLFIAKGRSLHNTSPGQFEIRRPLRLTPDTLSRNESDIVHALRDLEVHKSRIPFLSVPTHRFVENLIVHAVSEVSLNGSSTAYLRRGKQNITEMTYFSVILYAILVAAALAMAPIKELFGFFVLHKERMTAFELRSNDFDELSKTLRSQMEQANGMTPSGDFSQLETFIDEAGFSRVALNPRSRTGNQLYPTDR